MKLIKHLVNTLKEAPFISAVMACELVFAIWSASWIKECVKDLYGPCANSSGFIESYTVMGMGSLFVFAPLLLLAVLFDCRTKKGE